MKGFTILVIVLLLVILLIGCSQKGVTDPLTTPGHSTETTKPDTQVDSEEVSSSQTSQEAQKPGQEPATKAFVFDMSVAGPMNGAPVYEEGVYNIFAVFMESPEGYRGEVEITQKVLQAYDETSLNYQPDGYLINSFKSVFDNQSSGELPAGAKSALDQLSANDKGQLFYGMLPTATRMEMHFDANSSYFGVPC